jgi:hypothetical protein
MYGNNYVSPAGGGGYIAVLIIYESAIKRFAEAVVYYSGT